MKEVKPTWKIRRQSWDRAGVKVFASVGPLGTMYSVDKAGERLSSHGGGTDQDAKRRAFAAADIAAGLVKPLEGK